MKDLKTNYWHLTLGLVFLCASVTSCGDKEKIDQNVSLVRPVRYVAVGASSLSGQQTFSGIAKAEREESLSFKVSGTISKKYVNVGDQVKRGQLLYMIDPQDYQVGYEQAEASQKAYEAQIKSAEAAFLASRSSYERAQRLYESNSIALSDFENAKASYESSQASYEAAKKQAEAAAGQTRAAGNSVGYTRMTAPFAGIISSTNAEENETVSSGMKIVTLSSIGDIEVEVGVPENVISKIQKNQPVQVHFSVVGDEKIRGSVAQVGYSASGSTYPVTIELEKTDPRIRPDMPADVTFILAADESDNIILAPSGAVGEDADGNYVYKLKQADGDSFTAQKVRVEVGTLSDKGFVIKSGLIPGDKIASAGLNMLRDGMEVTLFKN